jgi:hypothetical protein
MKEKVIMEFRLRVNKARSSRVNFKNPNVEAWNRPPAKSMLPGE